MYEPGTPAYLLQLHTHVHAMLTCAESRLPYALRSSDFYALRSEGRALLVDLGAAMQAGGDSTGALSLRGWLYHQRLHSYLSGTTDAAACTELELGLDRPPDVAGGGSAPPQAKASGGFLWIGGIALVVAIAGVAVARR